MKQAMRLLTYTMFVAVCAILVGCVSCSKDETKTKQDEVPVMPVRVPLGGNTWVVDNPFRGEQIIGDNGVENWSSKADK